MQNVTGTCLSCHSSTESISYLEDPLGMKSVRDWMNRNHPTRSIEPGCHRYDEDRLVRLVLPRCRCRRNGSLPLSPFCVLYSIHNYICRASGLVLTRAGRVRAHFESDADHQHGQKKERGANDAENERQTSLALLAVRFDGDISDTTWTIKTSDHVVAIKIDGRAT